MSNPSESPAPSQASTGGSVDPALSAVQSEISTLQAQLATATTAQAAAESQLTEVSGQVGTLNTQVTLLTGERDDALNKLAGAAGAEDKLTTITAGLKNLVDSQTKLATALLTTEGTMRSNGQIVNANNTHAQAVAAQQLAATLTSLLESAA